MVKKNTIKAVKKTWQAWQDRERETASKADFIIFREKHGKTYVDTRTHSLDLICMAVFRSRDAQGWYADAAPSEPRPPKPLDVKAPLYVQEMTIRSLRTHEDALKRYEADLTEWRLLCHARSRSPESLAAALEVIYLHRDHEYEGFDFGYFTNLTNL